MTSTSTPTATPTQSTTTGEKRGTDAAAKYDPATDSSPQWKDAARKDGRVHLDFSDGACLCGCNQKADARFRPGHDATLKGKLTRAALNEAGLALHFGDKTAQTTARGLATKLNTTKYAWDAALDLSVERAKKAAAERAKRQAEAKAKRDAERAARGDTTTKLSLDDFAA